MSFQALGPDPVFSGHPDLPGAFSLGGDHPNFLDEEHLEQFENIPVFIVHGIEDRNCPFELTEKLVEKLKSAGADVEFHAVEEVGHGIDDEEIVVKFNKWLEDVLKK